MCALMLRSETPANSEMEDFTSSVAQWLKTDTEISRLKTALREARGQAAANGTHPSFHDKIQY